MANANLSIRVDKETKEKANELFNKFGLTMTTAVNMFLKTAIRENRIPFELKLEEEPNEVTMKAIEVPELDSVGLEYSSQLHDTEGDLYPLLISSRERDLILGHTSVGIHRDDLSMMLSDEFIRKVGSEGQRKTFLISLKLAQYRMLAERSPERPMLLLDDIFDKLDAERVGRIIGLVGGQDFGQIFITDTNRKYLDEIIHCWGEDYKLFSVHRGNISELA